MFAYKYEPEIYIAILTRQSCHGRPNNLGHQNTDCEQSICDLEVALQKGRNQENTTDLFLPLFSWRPIKCI